LAARLTIELPSLRGGPTVGWGIVGPGAIADAFATALRRHTDQRIVAVASRSIDRAQGFAEKHGIPHATRGIDGLLAVPEVDVVYIAGPHSTHVPLALESLRAGRHVLVEKPIALTRGGGQSLAAEARLRGLLVAEALWSRYLPRTLLLRELLDAPGRERPSTVIAALGATFDPSPRHRSRRHELGGGALADLAAYPIGLAREALGSVRIASVAGGVARGLDEQAVLGLTGAGGALAGLTLGMVADLPNSAAIAARSWRIELDAPFFIPGGLRLIEGSTTTEWADPSGLRGNDGLVWQAVAVARYLRDGILDSPRHPLAAALETVGIVEDARSILGAEPYADGT
jgi:predicted dehydrogenase